MQAGGRSRAAGWQGLLGMTSQRRPLQQVPASWCCCGKGMGSGTAGLRGRDLVQGTWDCVGDPWELPCSAPCLAAPGTL